MALSMGDEVMAVVIGIARQLGLEAVVEKEYDVLFPVYPMSNRYDVYLKRAGVMGDGLVPVGYYVLWREPGVLDTFVDASVLDRAMELGPVNVRQEHNCSDLREFEATMTAALKAAGGY